MATRLTKPAWVGSAAMAYGRYVGGSLQFTLRQLEYFVAVAETGSLSSAAVRCHVSQPGLSLALGQLEESLGVSLLVRSRSKGTTLSRAGENLLVHARRLLADAGEFQVEAERESGGVVGRLVIGCYSSLATTFVPAMLEGFGRVHPGITLDVVEGPQPELQEMLRNGAIELALLYDHQLGDDLDQVLVQSCHPYLLLPAHHPLARCETVSLLDVADEPLIVIDVPPSRENLELLMAQVSIEPIVKYQTQNFELARCLVGRGLGYSVLFQRPTIGLTYEGYEVVCCAITEQLPTLDVVLAFPAGVPATPRAAMLLDYVSSQFTRHNNGSGDSARQSVVA